MPSLLAVAAVHHHLVRRGTRLRTGLVIESGEPRDIHHMATLIGYGAAAINPYVMFESLDELADRSLLPVELTRDEAESEHRQGDRQGADEDDLEDGHLDDPVLLRRADLRGGRSRPGGDRELVHRHRLADRRRGAGGALDRGDGAPLPRLSPDRPRAAARRRRAAVAPRRRAARLEPGHGLEASARASGRPERRRSARDLQGVRADGERAVRPHGACCAG